MPAPAEASEAGGDLLRESVAAFMTCAMDAGTRAAEVQKPANDDYKSGGAGKEGQAYKGELCFVLVSFRPHGLFFPGFEF